MYKKTLFTALVLTGTLFFQMTGNCFADAAAELKQAKNYLQNGYYQQAEAFYIKITTENPGTDYTLEAQKDLLLNQLRVALTALQSG